MTSSRPSSSFLDRHYFLLRRLMSLTGIIPIGAYLAFHLSANATVLFGPDVFQRSVESINAIPKPVLAGLEITFIFAPIAFHAIIGFAIVRSTQSNVGAYGYAANFRYTLQRITGVVALAFILFHVFTMHRWGLEWFHVTDPETGAPMAYASTTAAISRHWAIRVFYVVGVLCSVYHFANGIWTFLITWGITVGRNAQRKAGYVCAVIGILLAVAGLGALQGFSGPVPVDAGHPSAAVHAEP